MKDQLVLLAQLLTTIAKLLGSGRIPGKRFNDLLTGPLGGRMFRDIEVHNPATMMCEDHKNKQHLVSHGWHHEEIDTQQVDAAVPKSQAAGKHANESLWTQAVTARR
jgi:hypothetical protein